MRSLLVALALYTTAHAETRPRYGGSVEATLLGAPVTFDPTAVLAHADITVAELVFDTLYRVGPSGVIQPHLAAAVPTLDATRTRVTIALREGVVFHDGSKLTSADVVASLERVRATPARWTLAPVASIVARDAATIEVTLRAPAELALLLALPTTAVTKGGRAPIAERVIGSGPFVVDGFDRAKKRLRLRAFDDHFAGRPYVDTLVLGWYDTSDGEARRFETGGTQVSARGTGAFAGAQPKYRAHDLEGPAALLVYVGFGKAHAEIMADRGFRRALDLALVRDALKTVTSGERVVPTREPVPLEAGGASTAARNGDLAAAQAALADAGRRVQALASDRLGQLKLEILVEDTRPDDREIAERVVRSLDKLGISSTVVAVSAHVLRERIGKGTSDLWIGQLAAPLTSAWLWWSAAFAAGGDSWAMQQLASGTIDPRAAQKQFAAQLPILPLMFRAVKLWHRSDVRGLAFDASGRPCFADIHLFGEPTKSRSRP
ncbi:MAG TPA: ABC transporter substrate-binding protein [Kofleriaceae bacterium]|nr:ABC transporter substrate-binding protein [Kofleriaceae bacterium]